MNVTGIAPDWVTGLEYAAIWAETSSLFSDWDAGFVRMSQGLRRWTPVRGHMGSDVLTFLRATTQRHDSET